MPKVKINISLSFILYVVLLIFFGRGVFLLNYLLVLFIHEYSHALVAYRLGYKLNSISLAPFGICLNIDNNTIDSVDSIKIAFAGPCINFVLAILCMAIWWAIPSTYCFLQAFFEANVVTGTFNLLPCYPLDGGRVLKEWLKSKQSKLIFCIINILFALLFLGFFFYFGYNMSFLMISIFLGLSILSFSKKSNYDYMLYSDKNLDNIVKIKSYVVPYNLPLFKLIPKLSQNTFAVFLIIEQNKIIGRIYENQLKDIFEINSPITILKSVVLKK